MNHFYVEGGETAYLYNTAGHLDTRVVTPYYGSGIRVTMVGQRDGMGRPLSINTTIADISRLHETLTWTGDGLLSTHSVSNALFLDERAYAYANLTRRLTEERLNLDATRRHTNAFTFDTGQSAGPGVLTKSVAANVSSPVTWSGGGDPLLQLTTETNSAIRRAAHGRVNGPATVQAFLDGQPVPLIVLGTEALAWHATLELSPGSHQLQANALHSSGLYTAATNHSFTVTNTAVDRVQVTYDAIGQTTQKIWLNANGTTNRTQTFRWDAKGRLHKVIERDSAQTGYDWTAVYDALNRRLQTTTLIVTNGAAQTNQPTVIKQFYDPQHAFLETAVSINGQTVWKVIGPSLNGAHGSLSGLGGFEATITGPEHFGLILSDARGNILGVYDPSHGTLSWNTNRPTGYGAVPGHRPPPLAHGADLVQASSWRGRWADIHGNIQLAYRPYDPTAARFLAFDPLGVGPSDNPFGFPADPINYDDPLGLFGVEPLKLDSGNPVAELLNMMDNFDAGLPGFASAIADAGVSSHMNLLNAINAETVALLHAAPLLNRMADLHWEKVFQAGMAAEAQKLQNAHLQALANPPPEMSYSDQWKYRFWETAHDHAVAALTVGLSLTPVGRAGSIMRGVALAGRADAAFGGAAGFGVRAELLTATTTRAIRAGEITTFQNFVDRSVVGDNLEGHELWQHANLKAQGLATTRLSTVVSQNNPVIALDRAVHQQVNRAQGFIDAAAQSSAQNINANAEILRSLQVASPTTIDTLQRKAIEHAIRSAP